jgi:hypothetical protein
VQTQDIDRIPGRGKIGRDFHGKIDGIVCLMQAAYVFFGIQSHDKQADIGVAGNFIFCRIER